MKAFISGVGKTRFGPTSKPVVQLAQEASLEALDDAGMTPDDIDAIVVANFLGGPNEGQLHLNSVVAGIFPGLHLPSWRTEAACASGGVAVHQAVLSLSRYRRILVLGVERLSGVVGTELARNIGMAGDAILDAGEGLSFPATYALVAQAHMQRYGTTRRDLELLSLKSHENANLNAKAHFYLKKVTQQDIDNAHMVASPLRLFDCCPISDGAAALVVSSERTGSRDIEIMGSAVASDVISLSQREDVTSFIATREAAKRAYEEAGVTPADLDLAEVHDCFTIAEIVAMEDLGLYEPGEAVEAIRAGENAISGRIPVNVSGGLKAGGHAIGATGVSQIYEMAIQLRGAAGPRQVEHATAGVTQNVGGVGGTSVVHVLGATS